MYMFPFNYTKDNSNSRILTPALHCPVARAQEEDQGNCGLLQPQEAQGNTRQETDRLWASSSKSTLYKHFCF